MACLVDPDVASGVAGGSELIALGRGACGPAPGPGVVEPVARTLGAAAAMTAVEVAAAFEMVNPRHGGHRTAGRAGQARPRRT